MGYAGRYAVLSIAGLRSKTACAGRTCEGVLSCAGLAPGMPGDW